MSTERTTRRFPTVNTRCYLIRSCCALFDVAVLSPQIYPDGIRHIRADKRVNEWKAPGKKTIVKCAVNQRQVVIALTGGEVVYFEMDSVGEREGEGGQRDSVSEREEGGGRDSVGEGRARGRD